MTRAGLTRTSKPRRKAAAVLAAFRAPYRGRSTPVNAWWGSFDLAANLFSGLPADPPSSDFIMRNAMDAQEVAVGWWPGDGGTAGPRSTPTRTRRRRISPTLLWPFRGRVGTAALGEFILDWDDVRSANDPQESRWSSPARRSAMRACLCAWDPDLAASADGTPPPVA